VTVSLPEGTWSWEAARRGRYQDNIANLMAKLFPQANVYSSEDPDNLRVQLNADGTFRDPGFLDSDRPYFVLGDRRP
jgi:hypothetical protein